MKQTSRIPSPLTHLRGVLKHKLLPCDLEFLRPLANALAAICAGQTPTHHTMIWQASKGLGKTQKVSALLAYLCLYASSRIEIRVAAKDSDQAANFVSSFRRNPKLLSVLKVDNKQITGPTGQILVDSADLSAHGGDPTITWFEEWSHLEREEFADTIISNDTKSKLLIITTNAGTSTSWNYERLKRMKELDSTFFVEYSKPPPWKSAKELRDIRGRLSKTAYQKYFEGKWVLGVGDALDQEDVDACTTLEGPSGPEAGYIYVAGLDLAATRDNSALCISGLNQQDQKIKLALAESWRPKDYGGEVRMQDVRERLKAVHKAYQLHKIYHDGRDATFVQQCTEEGLPMEQIAFGQQAAMTEMARALINRFKARTVSIFSDATLISELGAMAIEDRGPLDFRLKPKRTAKGHGDLAIAFALSILCCERSYHAMPWGPDAISVGGRMVTASAPAGVFASEPARGPGWDERDEERRTTDEMIGAIEIARIEHDRF